MQIEAGILFGACSALGAGIRTAWGYYQVQQNKKVAFDWKMAVTEAVPAMLLGFIAGATIETFPAFLTTDGIVMAITLMFGGAGAASIKNKMFK